jgi:hypothetical protein
MTEKINKFNEFLMVSFWVWFLLSLLCRCVEDGEDSCYAWDIFLQHSKRKGDRVIRICAWCRQEGKPGILEANPEELAKKVEPESHGICYDHGLRLRQSFKKVENGHQPHTRPFALLTN